VPSLTINLNDQVTVTVQQRGIESIKRFYADAGLEVPAEYDSLCPGEKITGQLYWIMNVFGPSCYMGPEPPIHPEILVKW